MTIDERLEFLLQSTESLHASCQQLHARATQFQEIVETHERRWELLRRVLKAALEEGLRDDGEEAGEA
jgi:hypothetical protein